MVAARRREEETVDDQSSSSLDGLDVTQKICSDMYKCTIDWDTTLSYGLQVLRR